MNRTEIIIRVNEYMNLVVNSVSYVVQELKKNGNSVTWWRDRISNYINEPIQQRVAHIFEWGVDFEQMDWDQLIILDGCRADLFEQVINTQDYDYKRVRSNASATYEWVPKTWGNKELGDVVYVTSNPYVSTLAGDSFFKIIEVWRDDFDEASGTVHPDAVLRSARDSIQEYPQKRQVFHFMQPHYPFIGSESISNGVMNYKFRDGFENENEDYSSPWKALDAGAYKRKDIWKAYRENLELVLNDVIKFANKIPGKTVIASDHGNMLGERTWPIPIQIYSHPSGLRDSRLTNIPWLTINSGDRPTITNGEISEASKDDEHIVEDRLRALGYR